MTVHDYERMIRHQELYDQTHCDLDEHLEEVSLWQEAGEGITRCSAPGPAPVVGASSHVTGLRATVFDSDEVASNSSQSEETITPKRNCFDLGIVRNFKRWFNKGYVVDDGRDLELVDQFDEPIESPSTYDGVELRKEDIPRVAGTYASMARMELNILEKDAATVVVVRSFLVRAMKGKCMRSVDIHRILPYAVQLSFLPTKYEILARDITVMSAYQQRLEEGKPKYTRTQPWLFNWFGSKVHEPVVQPT